MDIKDKNLYYIGGVVRDELLNKKSFDIDLTYVGDAIEFAKELDNCQIIKINKPFGTVRINYNGKEIDIASTRDEIYPQKGHLPKVLNIGCSLKEDILRRDFTINALAKSTLTGEIIDYTGGLKDLKNKILRVLHDKSFVDDPTRIVRGLKFAVRFGFELEPHTKSLQDIYLENVNYDMSYKRLKKELEETFNLNSQKAFEKFIKQKIYKLITKNDVEMPEINFEELVNLYKPKNIWIIYAGQIPNIENLPLTKIEKKIVEEFRNIQNAEFSDDYHIWKTFNSIPLESVIMCSKFHYKEAKRYLEVLSKIKLQITGETLKGMGISPGKIYQEFFDYLMNKKISNPKITKEDEIQTAKEFFAK